jgi:hypothetical protein
MNIKNAIGLQINSITAGIDGFNIRSFSKEYLGGEEKFSTQTIHDKYGVSLNPTYTKQRFSFLAHNNNVQFVQELQNIENTTLDIISRGKALPDNKLFLGFAQQGKLVIESYKILTVSSYAIPTEIITDGKINEFGVVYISFKVDVMPDSTNATPITIDI